MSLRATLSSSAILLLLAVSAAAADLHYPSKCFFSVAQSKGMRYLADPAGNLTFGEFEISVALQQSVFVWVL